MHAKCIACNKELRGKYLPVYASGGTVPLGMACSKDCADKARGAKVQAVKETGRDSHQREMFTQ